MPPARDPLMPHDPERRLLLCLPQAPISRTRLREERRKQAIACRRHPTRSAESDSTTVTLRVRRPACPLITTNRRVQELWQQQSLEQSRKHPLRRKRNELLTIRTLPRGASGMNATVTKSRVRGIGERWRFCLPRSRLSSPAGLIWQSSRSRIVPFIAVIDSFGRPIVSGLSDQTTTADERLKKATVLEWVEELRTVTTDGVAQRKAIDRVYSHIANNSPAMTFVSDFYRANQPFERAQNETVGVDVRSVLPTSDRTFEVDWIETSRDLYGNVKTTERWKGHVHHRSKYPHRRKDCARQSARVVCGVRELVPCPAVRRSEEQLYEKRT